MLMQWLLWMTRLPWPQRLQCPTSRGGLKTKVAFMAVSTIKQKDLANAVGGALQHAIIMRYMLETDQMEQGATAATWDTQ